MVTQHILFPILLVPYFNLSFIFYPVGLIMGKEATTTMVNIEELVGTVLLSKQ
jgi:hypothetical protein